MYTLTTAYYPQHNLGQSHCFGCRPPVTTPDRYGTRV